MGYAVGMRGTGEERERELVGQLMEGRKREGGGERKENEGK